MSESRLNKVRVQDVSVEADPEIQTQANPFSAHPRKPARSQLPKNYPIEKLMAQLRALENRPLRKKTRRPHKNSQNKKRFLVKWLVSLLATLQQHTIHQEREIKREKLRWRLNQKILSASRLKERKHRLTTAAKQLRDEWNAFDRQTTG